MRCHKTGLLAGNFCLTVLVFFDDGKYDSSVVPETIQTLRQLNDEDVKLMLELIHRMARQTEANGNGQPGKRPAVRF